MKQLLQMTLLLFALLLPSTAMAYDFEANGIYYMTDMWGDYAMSRIEPCNRVDRARTGPITAER